MAEMPVTLQASYCSHTPGDNLPITRIVLHDEEYPVSVHSAEDVAWFFHDPNNRTGSAHYVVDADSVQHCVAENTVAYHAPPNKGSIGIEHDGYARFSAAEWATPGSKATLARSAALVAEICTRRGIPPQFLTADMLKRDPQAKGITTHAQVSLAFGMSDHMDPGAHFPITDYLIAVRSHMENGVFTMDSEAKAAFAEVKQMIADVSQREGSLGGKLDALTTAVAALSAKLDAAATILEKGYSPTTPNEDPNAHIGLLEVKTQLDRIEAKLP